MGDKVGVENLKLMVQSLDHLVKAVEAAKADDGKVTWSDLLNADVLEHGLSAGDTLIDAAMNYKKLKEELKDLSVEEIAALLKEVSEALD